MKSRSVTVQSDWSAPELSCEAVLDEVELPAPRTPEASAQLAEFLPFSRPSLGEAEEREVVEVLRSGWLGPGHKAEVFEGLLRDYVGADAVLAVSSGTAALHLALLGAGVGPGTTVITTPMTWVATAHAIEYTGARPAFVDIDPDSLNLDPRCVEAAITDETRVVLPVHLAGQPVDLASIMRVADDKNLIVVEDAAHALGAEYLGQRIGSISPFTCFSFHANKNITTGEGGAVCIKGPGDLDRARVLARCGTSMGAWERHRHGGLPMAECVELGFKYAMPDLAAAVGIAQLSRLDGFLEDRARFAAMYHELLDTRYLTLPRCAPGVKDAHHLFIVRVNENSPLNRDEIRQRLRQHNVGTGLHYRPLHLHPYFRDKYRLEPEDLPIATAYSERVFSLPLHPSMSEADVVAIAALLNRVLSGRR